MAQIMIIRHAEKPSEDGSVRGVTVAGDHDPHELSVRGWQRAGGLAHLLGVAPANPFVKPAAIFASAASAASPSLRPQHTVGPLAGVLALTLNSDHAEGEEPELAAAVLAVPGPILICWHHEHIAKVAASITGPATAFPTAWPNDRFDMVWLLDRDGAGKWRFSQAPQLLLPGDRPDFIL